MVFDKKFSLLVVPKTQVLRPGETFEAEIIIKPEERFRIHRLKALFEGKHEVIWYSTHVHATTHGSYTITSKHVDKTTIIKYRKILAEDIDVTPFMEYKYNFGVTLPENALPTFRGIRIRNIYVFRVKAEIKWARDKEVKEQIIVLQNPEESETSDLVSPIDDMIVTLRVPTIIYSGEEFKGELIVRTRREKNYAGIRIDIIRIEKALKRRQQSKRRILFHRIAKDVRFSPYMENKLGFSLVAPKNEATFSTEKGAVEYYMQVVFEKKFWFDKVIKVPIKILRVSL